MSPALALFVIGSVTLACGTWVATNLRGSADALARRAAAAGELSTPARGEPGPPARIMSPGVYRFLGGIIGACGFLFLVVSLVEHAS
ncbi:hypothetical protein AB0D46_21570 [Streptomyces sp. NPDC048383]|uniref:hypothetical protein n=1 Tax=Streptomyces sp. NPDC048383 TaxID=3155386 RepID=UPI00342D3A16